MNRLGMLIILGVVLTTIGLYLIPGSDSVTKEEPRFMITRGDVVYINITSFERGVIYGVRSAADPKESA